MMSGGKPTAIMKAVTRKYHIRIGIFVRLMPGAREDRIAAMISTAAVTLAISASVIPMSQKSAESPSVYWLVESGTYMNQPPAGAASKRNDDSTMRPPKR